MVEPLCFTILLFWCVKIDVLEVCQVPQLFTTRSFDIPIQTHNS